MEIIWHRYDMLISIRENDPEFALKFGTHFHRTPYRQARPYLKRPRLLDIERPLSQSQPPEALLEKQQENPQQQQVLETESLDTASKESSKEASQDLLKGPLENSSEELSKKDSTPALESNTQPKSSQEETSDEWTTESEEISDHNLVHTLDVQEDSRLESSTSDVGTTRSEEAVARQEGQGGQDGHKKNIAEDPGFDGQIPVSRA